MVETVMDDDIFLYLNKDKKWFASYAKCVEKNNNTAKKHKNELNDYMLKGLNSKVGENNERKND